MAQFGDRAFSMRSIKPVQLGSGPREFPAIVEANGSDRDAAAYVGAHRAQVEANLTKHGAVLLRGFQVNEAADFSRTIEALTPEIINYSERSSPRSEVAEKVYTSTDHPADQAIVLHSEQSYTYNWPCYISFFCHTKALMGGNTPIADNRRILKRLSTDLVERFKTHGVLYQRTYYPGLGVSWQSAFQTNDRSEVGVFCRQRDIDCLWDGDILKTRQYRSAFQYHPITNELIWFNHALFFHITSLEEEITRSLIEAVGEDNVPTNTFYGNGEPITQEDIRAIRDAVSAETVTFDWQKHDVVILDNMLCQHGREPFSGERRVLTLMSKPYELVRPPLVWRPYVNYR